MAKRVRTPGLLAAATLLAAAAIPAAAQVKPGSHQGLGLTGAEVPPLLKAVQADPYRPPTDPACDSIPQEILALDKVLGPDVDSGVKTKINVGEMAMDAARGMIPYGGAVRFLTREAAKDKKLMRAATAGYARRGFLRGLEANLHCAPDAEPLAVPASARVADDDDAGWIIARRMTEAPPADGTAAEAEDPRTPPPDAAPPDAPAAPDPPAEPDAPAPPEILAPPATPAGPEPIAPPPPAPVPEPGR